MSIPADFRSSVIRSSVTSLGFHSLTKKLGDNIKLQLSKNVHQSVQKHGQTLYNTHSFAQEHKRKDTTDTYIQVSFKQCV